MLSSLAGLVFNRGHDVSRPDVMFKTFQTNSAIIFVIVLLRPSARPVVIATWHCTDQRHRVLQ